MEKGPGSDALDDARLGEVFKVLASDARLDLLRQLRLPRAAGDLVGRPGRSAGALRPGRRMSVEGVRQHLAKLREAGLVRDAPGEGPQRHVINRPRLYALAQGMLRLATLTNAGDWGDPDVTVPAATGSPAERSQSAGQRSTGPRLVLVMGVYEGRAYPLTQGTAADRAGAAAWTIGRNAGLPVSLDYDPYVSREHAWITRDGDGFLLHDAPRSQNGTAVNWRTLRKDQPLRLATGDVIGVGRSLLVFRAA